MSIKSQTKSQQLLTFQYLKFIKVLLNLLNFQNLLKNKFKLFIHRDSNQQHDCPKLYPYTTATLLMFLKSNIFILKTDLLYCESWSSMLT
jgi:hypothetical protein